MADNVWDEIVYLGDFLDFDQISKFNEEAFRNVENRRLEKDFIMANDILDRHQAIVRSKNKKAKFTYLTGNHELRVEKMIDKYPVLEGLLEVNKKLELDKRGFKYVRSYPNGDLHKIGKAYFHHGLYTSRYHAAKMVDIFGVNIFYGHTHDVSSHSKVVRGKNKTLVGQSLGCLCKYDLSYVSNNPTNWQQAVTTFYFHDNGFFQYYVSRIFNHEFIAPNGKLYA